MQINTLKELFSYGVWGREASQGLKELNKYGHVRLSERRKSDRTNKGRRSSDREDK